MSEFEHMFEEIKKEMKESAERLEQKLQELAERRSEEMRDICERHLDDMQMAMLKFKKYYVTEKNEETSSTIPTTNVISDIITIATTTGETATTLPSDEPNLHTDTDTTNNNSNNNNNNNIVESIVYMDDDNCYSNSDDESFLSSEDYDFVSSIQSSTFIGICLPPLLWNACDISSLATTILPKQQNKAYQSPYLFTITSRSNSFKAATVPSNVMNYYNPVIRLTVYDIYLYRIFIWDPGIMRIAHLYFYFT